VKPAVPGTPPARKKAAPAHTAGAAISSTILDFHDEPPVKTKVTKYVHYTSPPSYTTPPQDSVL